MDTDTRPDIPDDGQTNLQQTVALNLQDGDTVDKLLDDGQTNLQQTVALNLQDGDTVDKLLAILFPNQKSNRNESIEDIAYSGKCVTKVTQVPVESTGSSDLNWVPVTINYVNPIDQKPYTLKALLDPSSLMFYTLENYEQTTAPPNASDNETVESENPESSDNGAVQSPPSDAQQLQELPQNPSNKRKIQEPNENGPKLARVDKEDGQQEPGIDDLFAAVINKSPKAAAAAISNLTKILVPKK